MRKSPRTSCAGSRKLHDLAERPGGFDGAAAVTRSMLDFALDTFASRALGEDRHVVPNRSTRQCSGLFPGHDMERSALHLRMRGYAARGRPAFSFSSLKKKRRASFVVAKVPALRPSQS
jgi:hypothetical protein